MTYKGVANMHKKCIISILLVIFLFGTAHTTIITDEHPSNMLRILGIMEGYPDGTFRGDNYITRAEMAKIVSFMRVFHLTISITQVNTIFSDVTKEHWASGYIWVAGRTNIINGMGDGTFKPDDNVTYEQAVKMIVATLGYTAHAELSGGYPNGYIDVADGLGITSGVDFVQTAFATRRDIALMVDKAMYAPFWRTARKNPTLEEIVSYNNNDLNETQLTHFFDIPCSLFHYFNAFENADYETMKQFSTDEHIENYFNEDNVGGIKKARLFNVIIDNELSKYTWRGWEADYWYFVELEIETVDTSELYTNSTTGFYVVLKYIRYFDVKWNYEWKIDRFETDVENFKISRE